MSRTSRYRTTDDTELVAIIRDLQNRVGALERNPGIGSTAIDRGDLTIKEGSVRILDADGNLVGQLGKLDNGEYGIAALEEQLGLYQIPFVYTNSISTQQSTTSTTYTNLTTTGPSLTVSVRQSGRLLVMVTSQIQGLHSVANPAAVGGFVSAEFSGANTITADTAETKLLAALQVQVASTGNQSVVGMCSTTTQAVFEELTPGLTTITMKYKKMPGGAATCEFGRRTLTVITL